MTDASLVFTPPYTHPLNLMATLKQQGFALLPAADVAALSGCALPDLLRLNESWARLGIDNYLKDGGKYRSRRHGSCVVSGSDVTSAAHRAHWQPLEYNALHGGMERWFEPLEAATFSVALCAVLAWLGSLSSHLRGAQDWFSEVHQFRIDTAGGIGRPTPEGAHRDGVDLVAVFLVARERVKGGETRVFEADAPGGQRFTLTEPWSVLLLDDARMIHETTPIQPMGEVNELRGYRDTLVVTLRCKGFQDAVV
jgi:hypothetical protein